MKPRKGFTLVEMAVVLAIASILLTLGVKGMTSLLSSTQRSATQDNLNSVRNSLLAYFTANHRFPCPDTGPAAGRDGTEDRAAPGNATAACAAGASPGAGIGTVPYLTLGLTRSQALDGYGNYITYRVDVTATVIPAQPAWNSLVNYVIGDFVSVGANNYRAIVPSLNQTPPNATYWRPYPAGASFSWVRTNIPPPPASAAPYFDCSKNLNGALRVFTSAANAETNSAVVVLISHGANGLGAWVPGGTAATRNTLPTIQPELGNTILAPTVPAGYRNYPFSDIAATAFDDVVTFIDSTAGATEATGAIKTYASNLGRSDICH